MRYLELAPAADLAGDIRCLWEIDAPAGAMSEPIFPDGCVEIVVHLGTRPLDDDGLKQPGVMLVGQMTTALRLQQDGPLHAVGIRFTPAGARAWLGLPLSECTNRVIALDAIDPRLAGIVVDAVQRPRNLSAAADALAIGLRRTRNGRRSASRPLTFAVSTTLGHRGRLTVDALASRSGLGVRQLERQFLDQVGLTPKQFTATVRFQDALRQLRSGRAAADVAAACGFADQPHLAREFRRVAGVASRGVNLSQIAFLEP